MKIALPPEIIQDILILVPFTNGIFNIGLASKQLLAPIIFNGKPFARRHLQYQFSEFEHLCLLRAQKDISLGSFLEREPCDEWISTTTQECFWGFPASYRSVIQEAIVSHPLDGSAVEYCGRYRLTDTLKLLLRDYRVDPNRAIQSAVNDSDMEILSILLNDESVNHGRILFEAAADEKMEVLHFVLDRSDVQELVSNVVMGEALVLACHYNRLEVVRLLHHQSWTDFGGLTNKAFYQSTDVDNSSVIQYFLTNAIVDPSVESNRALITASSDNRIEVVKLCLADPRVDPSARDNDALIDAVKFGNYTVVSILLADERVDPAANNQQAIRVCCTSYNPNRGKVAELLLADKRVDPTVKNNEAIFTAMYHNFRVFQVLLTDPRVEPPTTGPDNKPFFTWAASVGYVEFVNYALNASHISVTSIEVNYFLDRIFEDEMPKSRSRGFPPYLENYPGVIKLLIEDARFDDTHLQRHSQNAFRSGDIGLIEYFLRHPRLELAVESAGFLLSRVATSHVDWARALMLEDPRFKKAHIEAACNFAYDGDLASLKFLFEEVIQWEVDDKKAALVVCVEIAMEHEQVPVLQYCLEDDGWDMKEKKDAVTTCILNIRNEFSLDVLRHVFQELEWTVEEKLVLVTNCLDNAWEKSCLWTTYPLNSLKFLLGE
ncbi:UNVERIFIED_CONTAM: hypothetical protein HDU68_008677 [Siphonaria sp. JEL0065]|nr:hypothetical protein HDU68_008677 [Siphonaria sp. JEL0065]